MANLNQLNQEALQRRALQKQKEIANKKALAVAELTQANTEVPKDLQESGQNKLGKYLINYTAAILVNNLPVILNQIEKAAGPQGAELIKLYETNKAEFEKQLEALACQNEATLREIVKVRDEINNQLTQLGNSFSLVNRQLEILNSFVKGQITALKALKLSKTITSAGVKLIPSPPGTPGIITSLLSDTESVIAALTFTITGNPKLEKIKNQVSIGLMLLSQGAGTLKNLLMRFDVLDAILLKCGQTITPIAPAIKDYVLQNITQVPGKTSQGEGNYKGFTLKIQEEQFSDRLKRVRAVAYNQSGIILLETPFSFTTVPQVLLDQLKFRIDSENLKAD